MTGSGYPCVFEALPGLAFCDHCRCRGELTCPSACETELGTCRKMQCVFLRLPQPLQAMRDFRGSLAQRDPVDLESFLEHSAGLTDLLQVCLLADIWEPAACKLMAEGFKQLPAKYSADDLAQVLHQVAREMSPRLGYYAMDDVRRSHLKTLSYGGACRHFGTLSLFKRLGIVVECKLNSGASGPVSDVITLGLGRSPLLLQMATTVLQDLVSTRVAGQRCFARARTAFQEGKGQEVVNALQDYVFNASIPRGMMWGRQPNYHGSHIVRKVCLHLVQSSGGKWIFDQTTWNQASPDANGYLQKIPRFFDIHRMSGFFRPLQYSRLSAWACLLGMAFEGVPGLVVQGFKEAYTQGRVTPKVWSQADEMAVSVSGHAAHPLWVAYFCMKVLQGQSEVTHEDMRFLLLTAPEYSGSIDISKL